MNVLIADDDAGTLEVLRNMLEKFGYSVTAARDGDEAYDLLKTGLFRILVTDWQMPGMTGLELCEKLRSSPTASYVYVLILTSYSSLDSVVCCLEAGADDYLAKPVRPAELLVRIRAGERLLNLESRELTIFALARLVESRDHETGGHLERIREYARILAQELSQHPEFASDIDGRYINLIYLTTPLHDIGKVAIPDRILQKRGKLTEAEFEIMKTHTVLGARTLDEVAAVHPNGAYLQMARDIALSHHERFDGSGYPLGLRGDEIPLSGRITALADVYDALTSKRPYKAAFSHDEARRLIQQGRGTHFDPRIVDAFLRCAERFHQLSTILQAAATEAAPQGRLSRQRALTGSPTDESDLFTPGRNRFKREVLPAEETWTAYPTMAVVPARGTDSGVYRAEALNLCCDLPRT